MASPLGKILLLPVVAIVWCSLPINGQVVLVQASRSCLDSHQVLTQECDASHIEYDDCMCIMQQLKCYQAQDCDYVKFQASRDSQCDSGIDNTIFTQVCSEFTIVTGAKVSGLTENTMIILLAIVLIDVLILGTLLCVPGYLGDSVYMAATIILVIAVDFMFTLYAYEAIRGINALWFQVVVGVFCASLQLLFLICMYPCLQSAQCIIGRMNQPAQTDGIATARLASFIPNNRHYAQNTNVRPMYPQVHHGMSLYVCVATRWQDTHYSATGVLQGWGMGHMLDDMAGHYLKKP